MADLSLKVSRTINAPIEEVYKAWLDPQLIARFMIPGPGMSVPKAEVDAREGGKFSIVMAAGGQEIPHWGEYKKLQPHSQIVFTWQSAFSLDDSTVTLNFSAQAGGTHVELAHVKFADETSRNNHEGGWTGILETLAGVLGQVQA